MSFYTDFEVRDYECDLQGIVNNAVYQNYYEHARHKFLSSKNIDFKKITDKKINLVLTRCEIDYQHSLTSGDKFIVTVECKRVSKLRCSFSQVIYLLDMQNKPIRVISKATFHAVGLNPRGRPMDLEDIGLDIIF